MAPKDETLVVLESFIGKVDGKEQMYRTGELIRCDDPAAKKWPEMFGPARVLHDKIEQATAAPGETRGFGQKMVAARKAAAEKRLATKAASDQKIVEAAFAEEGEPEKPTGKAITTADVTGH